MVIKKILKQADQKLRTLLTMSLYLSNDEKNLDVSIFKSWQREFATSNQMAQWVRPLLLHA